jgi:hypothetical protein
MTPRDYIGRRHLRRHLAIMATGAAVLVPLLAGSATSASANTVAQVGRSSVIAAEGPGHSLDFYWQTIGAVP